MSFGGLLFTNLGKNLQAKAVAGIQLNFTKIVIGDGELGPGSILDLKNVVHEIKALYITKLKSTPDGKAIIGTTFDNNNITTGFYWREIGVYANDPVAGEILYCYSNAGTNAEYIPASGGAQIIEKALDLTVIIGNATNVTATLASGIYASKGDLDLKADLVDGKVPSNQLPEMNYAPKENPQFTGIATLNGNEIATVNNIPAGLSLGETSSTAYRGDRGKIAYDHSQTTHAPTNAQKNSDITKAEIEAKLTGQISTHSHASDSTKAPTNHASTVNTYGLGTPTNFGHAKIINSLLKTSYADGEALAAYQGKVLDDKIENNKYIFFDDLNLPLPMSTANFQFGNYPTVWTLLPYNNAQQTTVPKGRYLKDFQYKADNGVLSMSFYGSQTGTWKFNYRIDIEYNGVTYTGTSKAYTVSYPTANTDTYFTVAGLTVPVNLLPVILDSEKIITFKHYIQFTQVVGTNFQQITFSNYSNYLFGKSYLKAGY